MCDWALDLAEAYLDGNGTSRDALEAAVITWRVEHGAFSTYSPNWGLCNNCDELLRQEGALHRRLNRELAANQKQQASAIAAERFPAIANQVRPRDTQVNFIATALFALIASAIWWRRRHRTVKAG